MQFELEAYASLAVFAEKNGLRDLTAFADAHVRSTDLVAEALGMDLVVIR